jgi:TonB-dependent SusC/RagA subfamily outer membrane receptor
MPRVLAAVVLLLLSRTVAWAQPVPAVAPARALTGTVTEAGSGSPIAGAVIMIDGAAALATSGADGSFVIDGVPAGTATLQIFGPGHVQRQLTLPAGQTQAAIVLVPVVDDIALVERAPVIAKANLANGATVVRGDELTRAPAQTVDAALQGKLAGANIQSNSGAPGGGLQLRLRGVSTITGQAEPLFIIDGVMVSNGAIPSGLSAVTLSTRGSNGSPLQDDQVNRIADLDVNDIASIEVLKGASASALYGSRASNGVVIITSRRGVPGAIRANVLQRVGVYQLSRKLGSRTFASADEAVATFGPAARDHFQPGRTFDHEDELAGGSKIANETWMSVAGGNGDLEYYASLMQRNDPGVVMRTGYEKQAGRIALDVNPHGRLRLGLTVNVIRSLARRGLSNNDNASITNYSVLPFTPNFIDLRPGPDGSYPSNPFVGSLNNPLQTAALVDNEEEVWRVIAGVNASAVLWRRDRHLLQLAGNIGVDRFEQQNRLFFPPELHFEPRDGFPGSAIDTNADNQDVNGQLALVHRYTGDAFRAATSLGLQVEQRALDVLTIAALGAGRPNVDFGTQVSLTQHRQLIRDRGVYLQGELVLLRESLALLAAMRAEQSSTAGDADAVFLFPKAQAAYTLPQRLPGLDLVRARIAYGEAGNQPRYGQKFTPVAGQGNLEGNPTLVPRGVLGNAAIRPERQREIDLGLDVVAFDGRGVLELSVYQKRTSDLLLERAAAPSTGYRTEFINGGVLRNRGIEVMLEATPIKTARLSWLGRIIFSLNRSLVQELPVPAFVTGGFGTGLGTFRIEQGKSATQIVGNARRDDGTCCEVRALGDTEPTFRMAFVQGISWGRFGASALIDWQQGSNVINLTRPLYDVAGNSPDFVPDGMQRLQNQPQNAGIYIEDASFAKLREIELHWDLPPRALAVVPGLRHARLTLAGRNLLTVTRYSGLDPEVSNFGNQPIARNFDIAPYPPSRSFWLSVGAGF